MTNPTIITSQPGLPFVDIVREFDAPVAAVFRAHTDSTLFAQWMGPRGVNLDVVEYDATSGGRWKYLVKGQNGMDFSFRGVFHTVEANSLIIQTFEFDAAPGLVGVDSTTFEEIDGRTRMVLHEVYPSVESRDMAVASGMESGIKEGYERLDEILAR
jgi:uncharacterized protein YndB with AHSA1/START domain